ncbi:nudC domain-containing protein 2-like isoform X2 [Ptychodera flava]|uniref:nudC domain-containing protein 2-like isoform X2 n=1 Tax=Ptychodera flava TaxID=63121 RepID=UPI003969D663
MSAEVHFDERSGLVPVKTPWGQWYQTMEEVYIEINLPEHTRAKEINVDFRLKYIAVAVKGKTIIKGDLHEKVVTDECMWSLEDRNFLRIVLIKIRGCQTCWMSLLVNEYEADPFTFDQMEKKLTLERFQKEYIDDYS